MRLQLQHAKRHLQQEERQHQSSAAQASLRRLQSPEDAVEGSGSARLEVHFSREECLRFATLAGDPSRRQSLRQLVLVGQPASSLDGAGLLSSITELWLVESQLEDAAAARECPLLEKLVLYSNRLRSIPDLSQLSRLHTLWLAGNFITWIKNLGGLQALEDLNLADNLIPSIGLGLRDCKRLSKLNLAGNPLSTLTECRRLCGLPSLRTLTLADPMYGATPMTRLCNYRSCVLLHLPQLTALDDFSVEPEELEQVRSFYASKARHMSMLRRHAEARYVLGVRQLGREAGRDLQRFRDLLFSLGQGQVKLSQGQGQGQEPRDPLEDLREEVLREHRRWEEDLQIRLAEHSAAFKMSFAQLECELENVGNVAVGVHDERSQLAGICQELLDRLSGCAKLAKYNIRRVKVVRVTHVCSRGTEIAERWRHAESQEQARERGQDRDRDRDRGLELQEQGSSPELRHCQASATGSKSSVASATAASVSSSTLDGSFKQGTDASDLENFDCENMFFLLCDTSRELSFCPWPFRRLLEFPALSLAEDPEGQGQPLVCNCVPLADARWLRQCYEQGQSQSLGRGRLHNVRRLAPLVRLARGTALRRARRVDSRRSQPQRCNMYRVIGPRPELLFLVEFVYEIQDGTDPARCTPRASWWREVPTPPIARYPVLDESLLASCIAGSRPDWARVTHVNLSGRGIKVLGELPVLPCVVDLNLSYNQLGSLGSLYAFPNLRTLNLSFNDFTALINMRELPALESLDLSWNSVRQLLVVLRTLSKYTPRLRSLQVAHNPVEDVLESVQGRHLAGRYLPHLAALDGCAVTREGEVLCRPVYPRAPAPARPTTRPVLPPEELCLRWRADHAAGGQLQPDRDRDRGLLCAAGRRLTLIQDPESWLGGTRHAELSDNLLSHGLGQLLAALPLLDSVSLARNALETLPLLAFQRCQGLRRLDLSGNFLQSSGALATFSLPQLVLLDLSGNQLQSLIGLENLRSLVELYLANNRLRNLEDLHPLKSLQELCVLDLTGNEVSAHANYKKFAVFHLRKLECVDGQAIEEGDVVSSRETFGGCLDRDALLTKFVWKDLTHLVELSMPQSDLRQVELTGMLLPALKFLDLSHNGISRLCGLHDLPNLTVLNLSHNQVRTLGVDCCESLVFPRLQVLFLNNNGITCVGSLSLGLAKQLNTVFLQNNLLNKLEDLGHPGLTGLVLDTNRLTDSTMIAAAKADLLLNIRELYIERNNLESLGFTSNLRNLKRLFVAKNKIMEEHELHHLKKLELLVELSLLGNPVCLRHRHYAQVRELLPKLELLDGHSMNFTHYQFTDKEKSIEVEKISCFLYSGSSAQIDADLPEF